MKIYKIFDFTSGVAAETDLFVSLTDPASIRQIVQALKNEGVIKKGCRYASYGLGDAPYTDSLAVYRLGRLCYILVGCIK